MGDYVFQEPEKLGQWFRSLHEERQGWDLFELTKALEKQEGIYKCSLQNKHELAQLLIYLFAHRDVIDCYVEIGICRCGTFYAVDQFLKTFAPNYKASFAIDGWHAPWTQFGLTDYAKVCPWVIGHHLPVQNQKLQVDLSPFKKAVCLIDCDHSYEITKSAWERIGKQASIVIFDDVYNENYEGPWRLWCELRDSYHSFTIRTFDPVLSKGNGLGVLDLSKPIIRRKNESHS